MLSRPEANIRVMYVCMYVCMYVYGSSIFVKTTCSRSIIWIQNKAKSKNNDHYKLKAPVLLEVKL